MPEKRSLLKTLIGAGHSVDGRLDVALGSHGLSTAKLGVLRHLVWAKEPLPLGQLAERLACVKSNVTQLIDRMEQDGLVRRVPDPEDRRSMRAEITPEGQRRYELGMKAEAGIERELLKSLSMDEQEQLALLLGKLRSAD